MTMWRSERSMKCTWGRSRAEGTCRGVVTRMAIDSVRRWVAMRRKMTISMGRGGSISIGRTGARCGSGTPGSRSRTRDGMTEGEVRGTIINLGLVQSGLRGLLDVLIFGSAALDSSGGTMRHILCTDHWREGRPSQGYSQRASKRQFENNCRSLA